MWPPEVHVTQLYLTICDISTDDSESTALPSVESGPESEFDTDKIRMHTHKSYSYCREQGGTIYIRMAGKVRCIKFFFQLRCNLKATENIFYTLIVTIQSTLIWNDF